MHAMLMMMDCNRKPATADLSGGAAVAVHASPEPVAGTWHPHVYGNPPRTPTAHNIADILGWSKTSATSAADEQPLNLSTAGRRPNGTTAAAVLDLTKIKRKGESSFLILRKRLVPL